MEEISFVYFYKEKYMLHKKVPLSMHRPNYSVQSVAIETQDSYLRTSKNQSGKHSISV